MMSVISGHRDTEKKTFAGYTSVNQGEFVAYIARFTSNV